MTGWPCGVRYIRDVVLVRCRIPNIVPHVGREDGPDHGNKTQINTVTKHRSLGFDL